MVEWDTWIPRGGTHNKARNFGFITCAKSNMLPCKSLPAVEGSDTPDYEDFAPPTLAKGHAHHRNDSEILPPFPYVHPQNRIIPESGSDYWCDLGQGTELDKRFVGGVIGSLTQAMAVLSGAATVYKNEATVVKDLHEELKTAAAEAPKGSETLAAKDPEKAAVSLINFGRSSVAGGTLLFYASVGKVGALATEEAPPAERKGLSGEELDVLSLS